MYAVEFNSEIKNGFIAVPDKYKDLQEVGNIRLIVMYDKKITNNIKSHINDKQKVVSIDALFDKFTVDFSNFKFNRDEANER